MIDNNDVIKELGEIKPLTEADRQMLRKCDSVIGRHMCLFLRHDPEKIGLKMNRQAWVSASELIEKFNREYHGKKFYLTLPVLIEIVKNDKKQRYGLKLKGHELMIRCRQGHSIPWIEMDYEETLPPDELFHGTVDKFLSDIMKEGLKPMSRNHVHLSSDLKTARTVACRRRGIGAMVILRVNSKAMREAGIVFYKSENGVWLTDRVPPEYLEVTEIVSSK